MIFLMMALCRAEAKKTKRRRCQGEYHRCGSRHQQTVATAKIQHPKEEMPLRVNEVNGMWQDTEILLPDGMLPFTRVFFGI